MFMTLRVIVGSFEIQSRFEICWRGKNKMTIKIYLKSHSSRKIPLDNYPIKL